jgi:hypothetical protein
MSCSPKSPAPAPNRSPGSRPASQNHPADAPRRDHAPAPGRRGSTPDLVAETLSDLHDRAMQRIALERRFRWWGYGVGHSQPLLHAQADREHDEHLNVLFEGVVAVKLQLSYQPLILQPADGDERANILAFARIPERLHARILCLTLPAEETEPGFIAAARATILANPNGDDIKPGTWNERSKVLHVLTQQQPS